jgi:hypothetical protein
MGGMRRLAAMLAVLSAISGAGAAGASASVFTASGAGTIAGSSVTAPVFGFPSGTVECGATTSAATLLAFEMSVLSLQTSFTKCKASFGIPNLAAEISKVEVGLTANQTADLGSFSIKVPVLGCTLTVAPQGPLNSVSLSGGLHATYSLTGLSYTSSGGLCGSSGTSGTYSGSSEYHVVGGGVTFVWDP